MKSKILVVDFDSYFTINDRIRKGNGGLFGSIKDNGFEPSLAYYLEINHKEFDPEKYSAVFFSSGMCAIRDQEALKLDKKTRKMNSDLNEVCSIYDICIEADKPVISLTHGSQILSFYTGGMIEELPEKEHRKIYHAAYEGATKESKSHWLFNNPKKIEIEHLVAREYRTYKTDLRGSDFDPLVYPLTKVNDPAIAIHKNPEKKVVLFFIHPEYDEELSAYSLLENVFHNIRKK